MEPSTDELNGMVTVSAVLDWVPFQGAASAALLTGLGISGHDPVRIFAAVTDQ